MRRGPRAIRAACLTRAGGDDDVGAKGKELRKAEAPVDGTGARRHRGGLRIGGWSSGWQPQMKHARKQPQWSALPEVKAEGPAAVRREGEGRRGGRGGRGGEAVSKID
eukprot:363108-Chlamydomonas_euryale.AAC.1